MASRPPIRRKSLRAYERARNALTLYATILYGEKCWFAPSPAKNGGAPDGFSVGRPLTSISRPISRVLYGVLPAGRTRDGHSSGTPVARRLKQPTRAADPDTDLGDRSPAPPLFGFAPGGVCRAVSVAGNAVRSYRTLSPLPRLTQRPAAVCSLWHFP